MDEKLNQIISLVTSTNQEVFQLKLSFKSLSQDMTSRLEELYALIVKLEQRVSNLEKRMDNLEQQFSDFKLEMTSFKDDMLAFKDDMLYFKDDMLAFKDDMLYFKDDITSFKHEMISFKQQMAIFEQKVDERFSSLISDISHEFREISDVNYSAMDRKDEQLKKHIFHTIQNWENQELKLFTTSIENLSKLRKNRKEQTV